ncbi:MAG: hypothetical protein HYX92_22030 [Chloroflexi bacterium]|nr:hypothetical protein [Chloroflexota bacterium]
MSKELVTVHNPTGHKPVAPDLPAAPRLASLRGKFMGILYNEKPGGDILLSRLEQHLSEAFGLGGSLWVVKHPGGRVTEEMLRKLLDKCDFVLNGLGD